MIAYTTANNEADLQGILHLQKANLAAVLPQEQLKSQGFVTVTHTYSELKKLNDIEKHTIAKDGEQVIAYLLAMTEESKFDLPVLIPMFKLFDSLTFAHQTISAYKYMVVGQICIHKEYRSKGILDNSYAAYKNRFYRSV